MPNKLKENKKSNFKIFKKTSQLGLVLLLIVSIANCSEDSVDILFSNADGGFNYKEFGLCCKKKEENFNVSFNKKTTMPIEMNILTNYFIMREIKLK